MTDLNSIKSKLDSFISNASGELKQVLDVQNRTGNVLDQFSTRLAAVEEKATGRSFGPTKTFAAALVEKMQGGALDSLKSHGRARFEVETKSLLESKATLLSHTGSPSSDLFAYQNAGIIAGYGGYAFGSVRRLFREIRVEGGGVFLVREGSNSTWAAEGQIEGTEKAESTTDLTGVQIPVQTLAHFVNVSRQALDDVGGLGAYLENRLVWGIEKLLEEGIVVGSGVATELTGLVTVASAFDATYLTPAAGWQMLDVIGAAAAQAQVQGFRADFVLLNPKDVYKMNFAKDDEGRYLTPPTLPTVVPTTAMTEGFFVVGDRSGAILRPRMAMQVDISEEHGNNFTSNLLTFRCEMRAALQILNGQSFVYGALNTSPA